MAHHSSQIFDHLESLDSILERKAVREYQNKLGATGQFPQGKLNPADEGEIQFAITAYGGKVIIYFGKSVAWIGMDKEQALALARGLKAKAESLP